MTVTATIVHLAVRIKRFWRNIFACCAGGLAVAKAYQDATSFHLKHPILHCSRWGMGENPLP